MQRRQWAEEQAQLVDDARDAAEQQVAAANLEINRELEAAKTDIGATVEQLSSQIEDLPIETESRLMARRFVFLFLLAGLSFLHAQEPSETKADSRKTTTPFGKLPTLPFLPGGIGYFDRQIRAQFFNARSADIQKAIQEATGLKMNADLRYSEIDRKMANLSSEVGQTARRITSGNGARACSHDRSDAGRNRLHSKQHR